MVYLTLTLYGCTQFRPLNWLRIGQLWHTVHHITWQYCQIFTYTMLSGVLVCCKFTFFSDLYIVSTLKCIRIKHDNSELQQTAPPQYTRGQQLFSQYQGGGVFSRRTTELMFPSFHYVKKPTWHGHMKYYQIVG